MQANYLGNLREFQKNLVERDNDNWRRCNAALPEPWKPTPLLLAVAAVTAVAAVAAVAAATEVPSVTNAVVTLSHTHSHTHTITHKVTHQTHTLTYTHVTYQMNSWIAQIPRNNSLLSLAFLLLLLLLLHHFHHLSIVSFLTSEPPIQTIASDTKRPLETRSKQSKRTLTWFTSRRTASLRSRCTRIFL